MVCLDSLDSNGKLNINDYDEILICNTSYPLILRYVCWLSQFPTLVNVKIETVRENREESAKDYSHSYFWVTVELQLWSTGSIVNKIWFLQIWMQH